MPCPQDKNKSLQGRALLSPGAGQAGHITLLTTNWLSLSSFIPSLLSQLLRIPGGLIATLPSRHFQ